MNIYRTKAIEVYLIIQRKLFRKIMLKYEYQIDQALEEYLLVCSSLSSIIVALHYIFFAPTLKSTELWLNNNKHLKNHLAKILLGDVEWQL